MHFSINNILSVPVLAFSLGIIVALIRPNLKTPASIAKCISLYLLFSIGFQGGAHLYQSIWNTQTMAVIVIVLGMSIVIPLYVFSLSRRKFSIYNAAALAASYGSVSTVTFITASSYLSSLAVPYAGYIIALVPFIDFSAIITSILLVKYFSKSNNTNTSILNIVREVCGNHSIVILTGGLLIGIITRKGMEESTIYASIASLQKIMLTFFLVDMGLMVGKNIQYLKSYSRSICIVGIIVPLVNAVIGILLITCFHINLGDSLLLVVLLASASYITVPATFRMTVPEADPSLYVSATLGITFPFNVIIGIPLYYYLLNFIANL